MELEFRDVAIDRSDYSLQELTEGMVVYADVGKYITNMRAAEIVEVDNDAEQVVLTLGPKRMDGPYYVPPANIHGIISK